MSAQDSNSTVVNFSERAQLEEWSARNLKRMLQRIGERISVRETDPTQSLQAEQMAASLKFYLLGRVRRAGDPHWNYFSDLISSEATTEFELTAAVSAPVRLPRGVCVRVPSKGLSAHVVPIALPAPEEKVKRAWPSLPESKRDQL